MKSYVKTLLLLARRVRVALARLFADMQHLAGLLALLMALLAAGVHAQQPPAVPTPHVECRPVQGAVRGAGYRIGHTYRLDYRVKPPVVMEEPQQLLPGDCVPEVATPVFTPTRVNDPANWTPTPDAVDAAGHRCRTWPSAKYGCAPMFPEGWCPTPTPGG